MNKEKYSVVETENAYYIADNEEDVLLNVAVVVNRLNNYENRLSNCIEPKFKIGQEVYKVYTKNQRYPFKVKIIGFKITKTRGEDNIYYDTEEDGFEMGWYTDEILFATEEEARAKLEELQNG